ncbi:competence type IV pilus minor pilin ComGD [Streptococcus sp. DD12]|uniref:competence type IV pilus minor pilin ComGD n=1 Tax=Streptococcus sp. DD12 TaxID=1777880 RepID=UPI0008303C95|nr:competence type IV pilus minor pilin ComGD [Streptococcus sp. DD12]
MTKPKKFQVSAFTLVESLVTLAVTAFLVMLTSGVVTRVYQTVEEGLFFASFESLYRHGQKLSNSLQSPQEVTIAGGLVSGPDSRIVVPTTIRAKADYEIRFNQTGGNSSLQKIQFTCRGKTVSYQLYIGSGRYKKSIS